MLQILVFVKNLIRQKQLLNIFPNNITETLSTTENVFDETSDGENYSNPVLIEEIPEESVTFKTIRESINRYLQKNNGSTEFNVLKDITDRTCESKEETIDYWNPLPLYLGLIGTMVCILVGICELIAGGNISTLLGAQEVASSEQAENAASGINSLLSGVAIAMFTSAIGVILTFCGTISSSKAIEENNTRKNSFLSWVQAELLPQMSGSLATVLKTLQSNLMKFNKNFSNNSKNLNETLKQINVSYNDQIEYVNGLKNLNIEAISSANIKVYKALNDSSENIEKLSSYLGSTTSYLENVEKLNRQLGEANDRTQTIEGMGKFFKEEFSQIEQRKLAFNENVAKVDGELQTTIKELKGNLQKVTQDLFETIANQQLEFSDAIKNQQSEFSKAIQNQQSEFSETIKKQHESLQQVVANTPNLLQSMIDTQPSDKDFKDLRNSIDAEIRKEDEILVALNQLIDNSRRTGQPNGERTHPLAKWKEILSISISIILIVLCLIIIITVIR